MAIRDQVRGGASEIVDLKRRPVKRSGARTQDIDHHVGARVRERRIMLGFTQQQLADLIGVTYQQAHKYERGINRISAGRLFEIANERHQEALSQLARVLAAE